MVVSKGVTIQVPRLESAASEPQGQRTRNCTLSEALTRVRRTASQCDRGAFHLDCQERSNVSSSAMSSNIRTPPVSPYPQYDFLEPIPIKRKLLVSNLDAEARGNGQLPPHRKHEGYPLSRVNTKELVRKNKSREETDRPIKIAQQQGSRVQAYGSYCAF